MEAPETSDWVAIIDRLGPMTVLLFVLVVLVGWVARQMLTSGAAGSSSGREIGRLEGLIEGHKDRLGALERRVGDLEKDDKR